MDVNRDCFLSPDSMIKAIRDECARTGQEELKTMPFGEIWEQYCRECGVPADGEWFASVKHYENEVLRKRG